MAFLAESKGWGLFSILPRPSAWLAIPPAELLFDLTLYDQHRAFHVVPLLDVARTVIRSS
jgi:hypothetical protein